MQPLIAALPLGVVSVRGRSKLGHSKALLECNATGIGTRSVTPCGSYLDEVGASRCHAFPGGIRLPHGSDFLEEGSAQVTFYISAVSATGSDCDSSVQKIVIAGAIYDPRLYSAKDVGFLGSSDCQPGCETLRRPRSSQLNRALVTSVYGVADSVLHHITSWQREGSVNWCP